jgi:hypothetical protein
MDFHLEWQEAVARRRLAEARLAEVEEVACAARYAAGCAFADSAPMGFCVGWGAVYRACSPFEEMARVRLQKAREAEHAAAQRLQRSKER